MVRRLKEAVSLDPLQAELQYRLGRAQFATGDFAAAERSLQRAIDEDVCPLRAPTEIVQAMRRVAASEPATLIDFEQRLGDFHQKEYGHRCFGAELFLDHVHPTIDGHRMLAQWVYDTLRDEGFVDAPLTDEIHESVRIKVMDSVDDVERGVALRNLAKVLHWAGKFEEAAPCALEALTLLEDDFASLMVGGDCLRHLGEYDQAAGLLDRALQLDPTFGPAYLRLGQTLARMGRLEDARDLLEAGLQLEPMAPTAHYDLGWIRLELRDPDGAVAALEQALLLAPEDPDTMYFLGKAERQRGNLEEAAKWFRRSADQAPHDAQVRYELGRVLVEQGKPAEAAEAFRAALQRNPEFEEADIQLQMVTTQADRPRSAGSQREADAGAPMDGGPMDDGPTDGGPMDGAPTGGVGP